MVISYSTWTDLRDCPKRFHDIHMAKLVPTVPVNEYHSLYGTLMQKFFELYSNAWRFKTPYLFPEHIAERMERLFDGLLLTRDVNWSAPGCSETKEEIQKKAVDDAIKIMEGPSLNLFLSTKAEMGIAVKLSCGHSVSGRLDFVHTDPFNNGILIFDGKGTTKKNRVDPDQLYWYSLLYKCHTGKIPDKIGFLFWKLDEFVEVPLNLDLLNEFRARISLMIKSVEDNRRYEATPSAKSCRYCGFANSCMEGMTGKVSRMKPSKAGITVEADKDGVATFGF